MIIALRKDKRGAVAFLAALTVPLVIGGAGLGVEVGYWRFDQVTLQQAADASAYAGALIKREGTGSVTNAATTAANSNGLNSASDTLAVHAPSTTTPGDANSVEVVIRRSETPWFTKLFLSQPTIVEAKATASFKTADNACMVALAPGAAKAIDFSGNSSLTVSGCSVMSNSIASNAINVQGTANVSAPCMYAVGGASIGGSLNLTTCSAVKTNQPPVADPYAALPMPAVSGACKNQGNVATLSPGNYCSLSFNKNVVLNPGVYVVDGGNLKIDGGVSVSGSGVTFYLKNGATVSISGNSHLNLSAPTTGTDAGILFLSDRLNTGSITINGDNTSTVTGVVYAPDGSVSYLGNFAGAGGCTKIVAQTISWSGNTTFNDDCSAYGLGEIVIGGVVRLSA